jgi:multiple sugar transport system substrate-binding protein
MSVAESADFLDPNLPPANSRIFIDTAATLRTVPILPTWPGIEETADNEIQRAFYGQVSVEEAAASAAAITQQYFDELQGP